VSVNPARSTGPALFVGGWALEQLWLFWVVPIAGALAGGVLYRTLFERKIAEGTPPEANVQTAQGHRARAHEAHAH
jgi:aquaporin Z